MELTFSRHARNRMRHRSDIETIVDDPERTDSDEDGRARYCETIDGTRIRVVLAADRIGFVVPVREREHVTRAEYDTRADALDAGGILSQPK